ncbi:hypothetical protein ACIPY0_20155 [Paenarthrobacter nicotinovorans]|uniref:hypothetical protein n=1 Tax=Paenarthrobacter nicotinovorans TaxID=29320 RepID=UPI0038182000
MAETTDLGFLKPSGNDLFKNGDNVISHNAQNADDLIKAEQAKAASLAGRIGAAEAALNAGAGGAGLSEDPDNPGFYYFAGPSFAADPSDPGYYLIGE